MLSIKFELLEGEVNGCSFGDISISGDFGSISSANRTPNQSMMIFLSVSELLFGIIQLLQEETRVSFYEFIGVGSSFSFFLEKNKNSISIKKSNGSLIEELSFCDFLEVIRKEISRFSDESISRLGSEELGYDDLKTSLIMFENLCNSTINLSSR